MSTVPREDQTLTRIVEAYNQVEYNLVRFCKKNYLKHQPAQFPRFDSLKVLAVLKNEALEPLGTLPPCIGWDDIGCSKDMCSVDDEQWNQLYRIELAVDFMMYQNCDWHTTFDYGRASPAEAWNAAVASRPDREMPTLLEWKAQRQAAKDLWEKTRTIVNEAVALFDAAASKPDADAAASKPVDAAASKPDTDVDATTNR